MNDINSQADPVAKPLHLTQILVHYADAVRLLQVRDTYDWHQRTWQIFGGRANASRDFLTRVDRMEEGYRLLIVSQIQPQKPDWCPSDCFSTKTIPESFFEHREYRFSLLANPTKKVTPKGPDGRRHGQGKRIALTKREDLLTWLQRKAGLGGFVIKPDTMRTITRGLEYFHKPGAQGFHNAVEFQGTLRIADAQRFRQTFQTGIGSAKAFGFGLLVIAPLEKRTT